MTTTELHVKLEAMDRREIIRLLGRLECEYGAWRDQHSDETFAQQFDGLIGYCQMSTADLREHVYDWAGGWDHEDEDPDSKWEFDINEELAELAKMEPEAYHHLVNEEPRLTFPRKIANKIACSVYDGMYISQIMEAFEQHVQLT